MTGSTPHPIPDVSKGRDPRGDGRGSASDESGVWTIGGTFQRKLFGARKEKRVTDLIERICRSANVDGQGDDLTQKEVDDRADEWAREYERVLTANTSTSDDTLNDPAVYEEVEAYFKDFERKEAKVDNRQEFEMIEAFVKDEKTSGRRRREKGRLLAASEEVRIAAEVAELKGYRLKQQSSVGNEKNHQKVADAEKAYASRKMAISKSARMAMSDCRGQFKRVRDFFQSLHAKRVVRLKQQYRRSVKIQSAIHRLRKTDARVMSLEQSTAQRIYKKQEADMAELNMIQNLEEADYLERIISLLDKVQETKEHAADSYFQLQIKYLKRVQDEDNRRANEITELKANSMLEMAELIAKYAKEQFEDRDEDEKMKEQIDETERRKDFESSNSTVLLSNCDLYDSILWSVATDTIGVSSSESDSFDTFDDDEDDEEELRIAAHEGSSPAQDANRPWKDNENASVQSGSTNNTASAQSESSESLSPIGHIFVKKLRKDIRKREKELEVEHLAERKREKREFRAEARALKAKNQAIVDSVLAEAVDERQKIREAIARRMAMVEASQSTSTLSLQEAIEQDVKAMHGAWREHKRLEEEQKNVFAKAQALISAQVFHEVRNALSSVVAMSEMASSLQKDRSVNPQTLVSAVSEMLDQNKEVVDYSLSMLNNILDVSKIKAGSFKTKEGFFDLQDLVNRATTMQLVKAATRGVKMSFTPMSEPAIAYTDEDIVVRIITNFISNAVKFTAAGAIQPFVCPLERIESSKTKMLCFGDKHCKDTDELDRLKDVCNEEMKMVAVGVADTGPGLSMELLNIAEAGLFNSDPSAVSSGAKNSGFGLHLAHQLAGTLGSKVNLTDLQSFRHLWNDDMTSALNDDPETASLTSSVSSSSRDEELPGKGTVLYITIPVVADGRKGKEILSSTPNSVQELDMSSKQFVFSPLPAPNSPDGCFRILVADDVSMLRKGLVRSVLDIFSQVSADCPVSVSTACTAEDAMRALGSRAYDLFICDNQFAPPNQLTRFSPEDGETRLQVRNNGGDKDDVRKSVMEFFEKESFTVEQGDGSLSGVDALLQLAKDKDPRPLSTPTPILVLHSGHQLELPRQLGIIVVRKPLKRKDFVPLFERNAHNLVETGMCREVRKGNETVVLNRGGAQLFKRRESYHD